MPLATTLMLLATGAVAHCVPAEQTPDLEKIDATNREVRAAFKAGDIERIALFHHDEVIKSLGPDRYFEGKDALRADLVNTLSAVDLAFGEGPDNVRESLTICGDTAIAITRFSIGWTPKNGDPGGVARGRAMIVMVRSEDAPYGWVTLREVIQPLP
ncbi:MAG: nuclear transport factor 2 family protein [Pseudomonadota bacterium]